ncbi:MAG: hypothetical protein RRA94_14920 [Bacteroidota bacterium]|nr:hypothetical protein [Bacteroidota bacterium]
MLYRSFEELPVWRRADALLEALRPLIDAALDVSRQLGQFMKYLHRRLG